MLFIILVLLISTTHSDQSLFTKTDGIAEEDYRFDNIPAVIDNGSRSQCQYEQGLGKAKLTELCGDAVRFR